MLLTMHLIRMLFVIFQIPCLNNAIGYNLTILSNLVWNIKLENRH